jgi:hypothetical protein
MLSLIKTRKNSPRKNSQRKSLSGTKRRSSKKSQKQKNASLEKLKHEIEHNILEKLKQSGFQQNIQQKNNKPISGHVEAGKKWSESEAGKQWEKEIDIAQNDLDRLLQQMGYDMSASGKYARELASKKRKNPDQTEQFAENIVRKIIQTKENQLEQQAFKQPKPISPVKLLPQTLNNSELLNKDNQTQIKVPPPIIGGFFDDSSSDEE